MKGPTVALKHGEAWIKLSALGFGVQGLGFLGVRLRVVDLQRVTLGSGSHVR